MFKGLFSNNDQQQPSSVKDIDHLHYIEPSVCNECGASYINGHWSWYETAANPVQTVCPACRRVSGNYPAGDVTLSGLFFKHNRNEILDLIRNIEAQENGQYPMERIIHIMDRENQVLITTTGIHLARKIGDVLSGMYDGTLEVQYDTSDKFVHVNWRRNA